MAYQFGVLTCIVVVAAMSVSSFAISLWLKELEVFAGTFMIFGLLYWYWDVPDGFVHRIRLLFRDGVPLAPYGFRKNATLGYWLGIPIIYIGHVITAGTLYVLWELSKQPTEGVPLGIGVGYAALAYYVGIALVESSYQLWAKRLNGVTPGDPGTSPRKPVVWSISFASILIVFLFVIEHPVRPGTSSNLTTQSSLNHADDHPAPIARVTLVDFIAATDAEWTGEAIYRVDNTSQIIRMPATLHGSLSGGDTVQLKIGFPNSSREPEEIQFQLSADGRHINGLAVIERTELANGRLRIVAYGEDQDDEGSGMVRETYILGGTKFWLKHHVEQEAGKFLLREEYKFARPATLN